MIKRKSVFCPNEKDHDGHKKTLLMVGENGVSVYCKLHGWVSIDFVKDGELMDFTGCVVIAKKAPQGHIETEPMAMISVGDFCKK